jgi:hypothetical protein
MLWPAAPARSEVRPRITFDAQQHGDLSYGIVTINDSVAAVVRRSAGGLTPYERARACVTRVQDLFRNGATASQIRAVKVNGNDWAVVIGRMILLLVTADDARAARSRQAVLAQDWTSHFRRLLSQPVLLPSASHLRIPLGEERTLKINGAAYANDIEVASDQPDRAAVTYEPATRTVSIRSLKAGRVGIVIKSGGENQAALTVPVVVLIVAGRILPAVTVSVTGTPEASADVLTDAYGLALSRLVDASPGATLRIDPIRRFSSGLAQGGTIVIKQRIRLSSPDMLPVERVTQVTLVHKLAPVEYPAWLLYCNNPEQVKFGQTLFTGPLTKTQPWRLVYHHQNISTSALIFHVDIINPTDQKVAVRVIQGIATPGIDTVQVGRRAGAGFLSAFESGSGIIHDIPPRTQAPVLVQRFAAGLTVSGLVQLSQLSGRIGSLQIKVSADTGDQYRTTALGRLTSELSTTNLIAMPYTPLTTIPPDLDDLTPYHFNAPLITVESTYSVGGPWSHVRIGHTDALTDKSGQSKLFGNYGADYDIHLTLKNPTTEEKPVGVFFAPEAGSAAGIFQIDQGPIMEFDPIFPPEERRIARYVLPPGGEKTLTVRTIPLNGSSYPASVVAHGL